MLFSDDKGNQTAVKRKTEIQMKGFKKRFHRTLDSESTHLLASREAKRIRVRDN